jgi:hypothetical protein
MKSKQDILKEAEEFKNIKTEYLAYNFVVKNFLTSLKSYDSAELYELDKKENKIPKMLISKHFLYTYNLTENKVESIFYSFRDGYDLIEVGKDKVLGYARGLIYFSGAGCCGGGLISSKESFENQLRSYDYDVDTLEKKSFNNRLLSGQWIKTDIKTNDIVQVSYENTKGCLLDEFKKLLPEGFGCGCHNGPVEPPLLLITDYSNRGDNKILRFIIVASP